MKGYWGSGCGHNDYHLLFSEASRVYNNYMVHSKIKIMNIATIDIIMIHLYNIPVTVMVILVLYVGSIITNESACMHIQ